MPIDSGYRENLLAVSSMSRIVYKQIVTKFYSPPTCCTKWNNSFPELMNRWQLIFRIPFISLRETKLQYFQYRFLHRILGTNELRHRMKIIESPCCTFCGDQTETIDHLFWECQVTSSFILDVEQCILGRQFFFTKEDIFFGYKLLLKHPYNFLIFHMKYYIFGKKIKEDIPLFDEFLYKFKFHIKVEKHISNQINSRKGLSFKEYVEAFSECPMLFD